MIARIRGFRYFYLGTGILIFGGLLPVVFSLLGMGSKDVTVIGLLIVLLIVVVGFGLQCWDFRQEAKALEQAKRVIKKDVEGITGELNL